MKFTKPAWVIHKDPSSRTDTSTSSAKRTSILSVHVHPDGSRIATGGLDAKIRIWSTKPILNPASEESGRPPKSLSTLTMHTGPVMTVRWANSGKWLASGSDDAIVMIWDLDPSAKGKVWGSDDVNVEGWKALKRLPGHESDITDVAWSPGDRYLASVGLDSNVIVWCGYKLEMIRKLDQHQGFVKGVCWDPVGEFFATQSDDKSVKIWRTGDWGLEAEVRKPFEDSPGSTFFRRLSWSPDGAHITASNATNNKGYVFIAAVIQRGSWTSEISLVGHENTIEVASYNPHIFLRDPSGPLATSNICSVVALGADDSSVSVWQTKSARPLIVAKEVFERQIMDLSWSKDGLALYAVSSDGTLAAFHFKIEELEGLAPTSAQETYLKKFNFVSPPLPEGYSHHSQITPPPSPSPKLKQEVGRESQDGVGGGGGGRGVSMGSIGGMNGFHSSANMGGGGEQVNVLIPKKKKKGVTGSQVYTFTHPHTNGKVPSAHPHPQAQSMSVSISTNSAAGPSTATGSRMFINSSTGGHGRSASPMSAVLPISNLGNHRDITTTITKTGTKNAGANGSGGGGGKGMNGVTTYGFGEDAERVPPSIDRAMDVDPDPLGSGGSGSGGTGGSGTGGSGSGITSDPSPNPSISILATGSGTGRGKRKSTAHEPGDEPRAQRPRTMGGERTRGDVGTVKQLDAGGVPGSSAAAGSGGVGGFAGVGGGSGMGIGMGAGIGVVLPVPPVLTYLKVESLEGGDGWFEGRNPEDETGYVEVSYIIGKQSQWVDYLPSPVISLVMTSHFMAVATKDGCVNVYSPNGRRLMPTMALGAACHVMEGCKWSLMVITCAGQLFSWNIKSQSTHFAPTSLSPLFPSPNTTLLNALIRPNGLPILVYSNHVVYTYAPALAAFTKLSDNWWSGGSEAWQGRQRTLQALGGSGGSGNALVRANSTNASLVAAIESAVVPLPESNTPQLLYPSSSTSSDSSDEDGDRDGEKPKPKPKPKEKPKEKVKPEWFALAVTLGHLETRMHAARLVESGVEYKQALLVYAKRVGDEGFKGRAEEVVRELFGPVYWRPGNGNGRGEDEWCPTVAGLNKRELLKDVLTIFVRSKTLTKFAQEWQDILKRATNGE